MNILANPPPGGALPVAGANGAVVSDASGTATITGNVAATGATAVVIDNVTAQTSGNIAVLKSGGTQKVIVASTGSISVPSTASPAMFQGGANASLAVRGNRSAADTGADVVANSTATRTAGTIFQVQNNTAAVNSFDFNGKMVPASMPTVKAAGAAFCGSAALDTNGTVTIATTAVTATSLILCWMITAGGTVGGLYRAATADISAGTSFIIRSFVSSTAGAATAATLDTSTVGWLLIG